MTRQDPGAATGTQTYPDRQWCECDHDRWLHRAGAGLCSSWRCGCRRFVERPVTVELPGGEP